ncbi:hypothetical protein PUR29_36690 [Methylobacterium ajmalii]|uniref:Uncharacterized protein n=1 Tax=Methylobacterium ajmalii TaxID=2738439 RepID=A0ABV0A7A9_9HYPH
MKTVSDVLDALLALYTAPGTWTRQGVLRDDAGREVAWDLEAALYRVAGDPEEDGISDDEAARRQALVSGTFEACGVELMALNDAARRQGAVVAVLQAGRAHVAA